ncbi:MAG: DUF1499 domain-containing protein [Halioglobus sp.]
MSNLLFVLPLTALLLVGCTSAPKKPATGSALPPCGSLPNCVNSENGQGNQGIDPIPASMQQWQSLKAWLGSQDNWTITSDDGSFVQAVATTPVMRFRDDVQLRFDEEAGLIHVRSSSRLGIGDMGANRSRVEGLRDQVRAS